MNTSTSNLKEKVVKRAVNSLRKSKRIEQLSFVAIANELNVSVDEIQAFYTTTEDIFVEAQKKDWESLHRYWDRHIKKSKTPRSFRFFYVSIPISMQRFPIFLLGLYENVFCGGIECLNLIHTYIQFIGDCNEAKLLNSFAFSKRINSSFNYLLLKITGRCIH